MSNTIKPITEAPNATLQLKPDQCPYDKDGQMLTIAPLHRNHLEESRTVDGEVFVLCFFKESVISHEQYGVVEDNKWDVMTYGGTGDPQVEFHKIWLPKKRVDECLSYWDSQ